MKANPLISILMTSYNREYFIAEAIESVLNSTYQNFELIIVDDQSNDKTVLIANQYASKDNRIKVYVNKKNIGDYHNRNKAASYANGDYIKYLDSDDLIYPWGLEILIKSMLNFPDAGWGLCSQPQDKEKIFPFVLEPESAYKYHYFGPGLFSRAPLSSIIRTDVFRAVGGFTGKQHLGDFELWNLLALKYNVVLMPQGIVWYREHANQQMSDNRLDPVVNFKYIMATINFFKSDFSIPLSADLKNKVINIHRKRAVRFIVYYFYKLKFNSVYKLLKFYFTTNITIGK
jgi:glycosyltransferase involved in cell wall biosynthesis